MNKLIKKLFLTGLLLYIVTIKSNAQVNLIPYPNKVETKEGVLKLKKLKIAYVKGLDNELNELKKLIAPLNISVIECEPKHANVKLEIDTSAYKNLGNEGYKLNIDKKKNKPFGSKTSRYLLWHPNITAAKNYIKT